MSHTEAIALRAQGEMSYAFLLDNMMCLIGLALSGVGGVVAVVSD